MMKEPAAGVSTRPSSAPVDEALTARIRDLIGDLEWSQPVGPAHMPFLQIPANHSARELVKIGKPAVPFLIETMLQPERTAPILKKKHVAAVEILALIGDKDAVPGILEALDRNEHDASFVRAAVKALGKLGDERAVPLLESVAKLSRQVAEVVLHPNVGEARPNIPEDVRWWIEKGGLGCVDFAFVWMDCYESVAAISPRRAMIVGKQLLTSDNKMERLAAVITVAKAGAGSDELRQDAVIVLKRQQTFELDPDVREMIAASLTNLVQDARIPGSRPAP